MLWREKQRDRLHYTSTKILLRVSAASKLMGRVCDNRSTILAMNSQIAAEINEWALPRRCFAASTESVANTTTWSLHLSPFIITLWCSQSPRITSRYWKECLILLLPRWLSLRLEKRAYTCSVSRNRLLYLPTDALVLCVPKWTSQLKQCSNPGRRKRIRFLYSSWYFNYRLYVANKKTDWKYLHVAFRQPRVVFCIDSNQLRRGASLFQWV